MAIINQQLANTYTPITVPNGKTWAITNILVCNQDLVNTFVFDIHLVPNGDPISNSVTRVINNLSLGATETFSFDTEKIVLEEGDSITFLGNVALSATISYLEV